MLLLPYLLDELIFIVYYEFSLGKILGLKFNLSDINMNTAVSFWLLCGSFVSPFFQSVCAL